MNIEFATCERWRALEFLQKVMPGQVVTDTDDCAKPLLDFVEADIVRVQDPMMYGTRIAISPGTHWDEAKRDEVVKACQHMQAGAKPKEPK